MSLLPIWICAQQEYALFDIRPDVGGFDTQSQGYSIYADSTCFYAFGDLLDTTGNDSSYIALPWFGGFDYSGEHIFTNKIWEHADSDLIVVAHTPIRKSHRNTFYIFGMKFIADMARPYLFEYNPHTAQIDRSILIDPPYSEIIPSGRNYFYIYGNYIFAVTYFEEGNRYRNVITRLTLNLEITDQFMIALNEWNNFTHYFEVETDTSFIIIGMARKPSDPSLVKDTKPFFLKVNASGDILRYMRLSSIEDKSITFAQAYSFAVIHDEPSENWILAPVSFGRPPGPPTSHFTIPVVMAVSPGFDSVLWMVYLRELNPDLDDIPESHALARCPDGSGYATTGSGYRQFAFLHKTSPDGDSLWLRQYIPLGWEEDRALWSYLYDIKATPFNTFLACGIVYDRHLHVRNAWVIHTDSMGCIVPGCDRTVSTSDPAAIGDDTSFTLYPNPASGQLFILSRHSSSEPFSLAVATMTGQIIKTTRFHASAGSQYIVSLDSFAPGTYVFSIMNAQGEPVHAEKIKVMH